MTRGGADVELDRLVLGTVPIHASHFLLQRGWRYKRARKFGGGEGALPTLRAWLARRATGARKMTKR